MDFVELEYPMNNISAIGGRREGYIEGVQVHGYMLVRGYDAFSHCLDLMM